MSVAKVIEIKANSEKSFEDAITQGVKKASETVKNIREVWVKDHSASVRNDKVVSFNVGLKITFEVE